MEGTVSINDKDLKVALHFMISTATILESMARDISQIGGMSIDYKFYENKI